MPKDKKKKKQKTEKGAEGGGTSSGESSGGPMTPERLKEIVESVNSEGNLTSENTYEFDDKVLRDPSDYSGYGYSTHWDKEEDNDPANNVEVKSVLDDVRTPILKAEGFTSGPRPAWLQPVSQVLVLMLTEEGYLEQNPIAPPVRCLDRNSASSVITQFSTLPLEQIHHFAYNGEYMNALFKGRKLIDILIHIEDRTFCGHRCILCAHSGYFSSVLVDSAVPPYAITDVTLKSIDPDQFKKFLNFTYTGEIFLTLSNVESYRNLANKLKSKTLRAKIAVFLSKSKTLTLDEALQILLDHAGDEEFLRPLAMETVVKNFKQLLLDPGRLCHFPKEDLLYVLQADNLAVDSELDVFWAILYWTAVDPVGRAPAMNRLMSAVRFTTMSSLELMDCARASDLVRLSKRCQSYLINANWVCHVREVGLEDPLSLHKEQKRSSLAQSKHEPSVAEFDMRFLIYNALLHDREGQIVEPPHAKETEGKLHDHLSTINLPSRGSIQSKKSVKFASDDGQKSQSGKKGKKDKKGGKKENVKKGGKEKKGNKGKKGKKDVSDNHNISGNYDKESDSESGSSDTSSDRESEAPATSKQETAIIDLDLSPRTASPSPANPNKIDSSHPPTHENNNKTSVTGFSDSSIIFESGSRGDVDALQLWEKSATSSAELLLLGGDILQPRRSHTVNLTRSRPSADAAVSGSSSSQPVPTSMEVMGENHSLELTPSDDATTDIGRTLPLAAQGSFDGGDVLSTADTSDQVTFPDFSEENPQENFNFGGHDADSRENTSVPMTSRTRSAKRQPETSKLRRYRGESGTYASEHSSSSSRRATRASRGHTRPGGIDERLSLTDNDVTTRLHLASSLDDQPTLAETSDDLIHL